MCDNLPQPQGVTMTLNKLSACCDGGPGDPAIGFRHDETIGWYLDCEKNVIFTSGMDTTMSQNDKFTEFRRPIVIKDYIPSSLNLVGKGLLYKKPNDHGLWWKTIAGEVNLASGQTPVLNMRRNYMNPLNSVDYTSAVNIDNASDVSSAVNVDNVSDANSAVNVSDVNVSSAVNVNDPSSAVNVNDPSSAVNVNDLLNNLYNTNPLNSTNALYNTSSLNSASSLNSTSSSQNVGDSGVFSDSGVFPDSFGNVRIKCNGLETATIDADAIRMFRPMEILESAVYDDPITPLTGFLYKKMGEQGLWWRTVDGDIDLTNKNKLPDKLLLPNGTIQEPAYSFSGGDSTGFSLVAGNLVASVGGTKIKEYTPYGTINYGKIMINDSRGSVSIYKKPNSNDLYASTADDVEVNLTSVSPKFPLQVPVGASVDFADLCMLSTGSSIEIADALSIQKGVTKITGLLEINEHMHPDYPLDSKIGNLYKEFNSNNLVWQTKDSRYILNRDLTEFKAQSRGNLQQPEFTFINDSDTGITKIEDDVLGVVAGGQLVLAAASDQTIIYKPLAISDAVSMQPVVPSEGKLYKKINDPGLYWQTSTAETDITKPVYPLKAPNGSLSYPSYSFGASPGCGMTKLETGPAIVVDNEPVVVFGKEALNINTKISISNNENKGVLEVRHDKLFWNDTDLCNGVRYPMYAPDGELQIPVYSFASNQSLGITKHENSLMVVNNGRVLADFNPSGTVIPTINSNKVSIGPVGSLQARGPDLWWITDDGKETLINTTIEEFTGGAVSDEVKAPSLAVMDYRITGSDGYFAVEKQGTGQVLAVTDAGLKTSGLILPNSVISENDGVFSISSLSGDALLSISDQKLEIPSGKIDLGQGILQKIGDSVFWQSGLTSVDLTDKNVNYPLRAPLMDSKVAAYGFEGSDAGISLVNNKLVLNGGTEKTTIENNGTVSTPGLNTGTVYAADGLTVISGVDSTRGITRISKDRVETSGVYRGKRDAITFGYDLQDYTVGISQSCGGLAVTSGKATPVLFTDNSVNIRNRNVAFNDALLERRGLDLYWKVGDNDVLLSKPAETWYKETVNYTTGGEIRKGDIVCMDPDGSGKIFKGIGGKIRKLEDIPDFDGRNKSLSVFDYDSDKYVLAFTQTKLLERTKMYAYLYLISKKNNKVIKNYVYTLTTDEYPADGQWYDGCGKILQISSDVYAVVYMISKGSNCNVCKIQNPFGAETKVSRLVCDAVTGNVGSYAVTDNVSSDLVTGKAGRLDNMTAGYDQNTDFLVIVAHSEESQNFVITLVSIGREFGEMKLGTVETSVCNTSIADTNKQIHLVMIPGGTCIISYGIIKLVFIVSSYQGAITTGECYMDYETMDCAGMYYDNNHGVVITLEKTVSGSCYIQVLDVIGITVHKLSSKSFKNANIEPLGISYNSTADVYAMSYATGPTGVPVYIQPFEFDGDQIKLGIRYQDGTCLYEPAGIVKHENYLFEIPGTKLFLHCYDPNVISTFEIGYNGNPAGYIGIATNDAKTGHYCSVVIKGHIYAGSVLPFSWLGKKIYITDPSKNYPECLSTNSQNSVFLGTCVDNNKILLGL